MIRTIARSALLASLAGACMPAVGPEPTRRDTEASPAPEPSPPAARTDPAHPADPAAREGPLELVLDDAPPRAPATALAGAPGRELAPAHPDRFGWSSDARTFAHCRRLPGPECTECRLLHRDGLTESLEAGPGCGETSVPPSTLDARLAALSLTPAPSRWPLGAEYLLVVETRQAEATNAGEPRAVLKLGIRRREGAPPSWLLHIDPCEGCGTDQVCAAQAHFDALALDPHGTQLAVLIHALASDGSESLRVELLATEKLREAAHARASSSAR